MKTCIWEHIIRRKMCCYYCWVVCIDAFSKNDWFQCEAVFLWHFKILTAALWLWDASLASLPKDVCPANSCFLFTDLVFQERNIGAAMLIAGDGDNSKTTFWSRSSAGNVYLDWKKAMTVTLIQHWGMECMGAAGTVWMCHGWVRSQGSPYSTEPSRNQLWSQIKVVAPTTCCEGMSALHQPFQLCLNRDGYSLPSTRSYNRKSWLSWARCFSFFLLRFTWKTNLLSTDFLNPALIVLTHGI